MMKVKILKSKLQKNLEKIITLQWAHFWLFSLVELYNLLHGNLGVVDGGFVIFLLLFYRYFFRTVREFYYTFWSFSVFYFVVFAYRFFAFACSPDYSVTHLFYLLAMLALALEAWLLSGPVFFPKVSWWEYDFRYRDDVKVLFRLQRPAEVPAPPAPLEGRLIDWRGNEACVLAFEDFAVGEILNIEINYGPDQLAVVAEVYSQRHSQPGRGYLYGIKLLYGEEQEELFAKFVEDWAHNRIAKKKRKYSDWQESNREQS